MLRFIRVVLPGLLMVGGIVWIIVGGATEDSLQVGIPIFSAGAAIWFVNFLWRVGVSGDRDRDVEDEAREYFRTHGHWPDERQGGTGAQR